MSTYANSGSRSTSLFVTEVMKHPSQIGMTCVIMGVDHVNLRWPPGHPTRKGENKVRVFF